MKITLPPNFNDQLKNGGFQLARGFIIDSRGGRGGTNYSFYFVQDCRFSDINHEPHTILFNFLKLKMTPSGPIVESAYYDIS